MTYQCVGARESYVGLEQGVIGINAGGLQRVKVPPQLTYCERERFPTLPENVLLFYQIKLLRIQDQWDNIFHIRRPPYYSTKEKVLAWIHKLLPVSTSLRSPCQTPCQIIQQAMFREAEKNRQEAEQHARRVSSEITLSVSPDELSA